jgi:hypothetical protein
MSLTFFNFFLKHMHIDWGEEKQKRINIYLFVYFQNKLNILVKNKIIIKKEIII